ncbi:MAG: hypothetical protein ABI608_04545, partial [Rhizomicrobium sp.]
MQRILLPKHAFRDPSLSATDAAGAGPSAHLQPLPHDRQAMIREQNSEGLVGVKRTIRTWLDLFLRRHGAEIVPTQMLYEWQLRSASTPPRYRETPLPDGAAEYLTPDNPKLIALQQRYRGVDPDVTDPAVWTDRYVLAKDIAYFRGDNGWVWQVRGRNTNILSYALSAYYLKSIDRLGL